MRRRLITILSVLSLLLCVAVCVLWLRSHSRSDEFRWKRAIPEGRHARKPPPEGIWRFHAYSIRTVHGGLLIRRSEGSAFHVPGLRPYEFRFAGAPGERPSHLPRTFWDRLGFRFSTGHNDRLRAGDEGHPHVVIPLWSIGVLFGLLPAMAAIRLCARGASGIRGRIRIRARRCPRCAYDLRATPERCPECGAVPAKAPA